MAQTTYGMLVAPGNPNGINPLDDAPQSLEIPMQRILSIQATVQWLETIVSRLDLTVKRLETSMEHLEASKPCKPSLS
jgi:hypothetical protein